MKLITATRKVARARGITAGKRGSDRASLQATPPHRPEDCVFALTTRTISADLETKILPCQFGGTPDCANCGCLASAGMTAIARHHVLGFIPVGKIFTGSMKVGERMRRLRPVQPAAG